MKLNKKSLLLYSQIGAHLSIVPMVLYAKPVHYLAAFSVYFLTGCLGMSMTYHRLLSHRSWRAPRWFERMGTLFATVGLTGSTIGWIATHREHHRFTEKEEDPHSPLRQSAARVQFLSMLRTPSVRYAKDLLRDPFHKWVHRRYFYINAAYALALYAIDPFAVIYLHLFPAAVLWNAGSSINTIGHLFGYRNFETKDNSKNNPVLGYLMWGEGWHNNHHHAASRPYFGTRWFEWDISGALIKLLGRRKT